MMLCLKIYQLNFFFKNLDLITISLNSELKEFSQYQIQ